MVALSRRGKTTMSTAVRRSRKYSRKLSRMTRLIRLRPVAFLSTCRDTAMPKRGPPRSFGRARTLKQRSAETTGFEKTLLNSIGFLSRDGPGKAAGAAGTGWCRPAVDSVTVHGLAAPGALACQQACAGARKLRTSSGEALAALGAPRLDDGLPGARRHTGAETVSASTLQAAWLECTFHCSVLSSVRSLAGPGAACTGTYINTRQKSVILTFWRGQDKMASISIFPVVKLSTAG